MSDAIDRFAEWLPGEMAYSASKAGYDKKVERAYLPLEERRSISGFLSTEWFNYRKLKDQGAYHVPFHGMSAQLQLAKFAAGLFDKAALARWMAAGAEPVDEAFQAAAAQTAEIIVARAPWDTTENPLEWRNFAFEETPFADGVYQIMRGIVLADRTDGTERLRACKFVDDTALEMGALAVRCYDLYAHEFLTPEQLVLPVSELAA